MNKAAKISGYIFIAIMSLCKGFALNASSLVYYVIASCSMIFLLYKVAYTNFSKKESIIYCSALFLAIITFNETISNSIIEIMQTTKAFFYWCK